MWHPYHSWADWEQINGKVLQDGDLRKIIEDLQAGSQHVNFLLIHGRLYHKGRLVLPAKSPRIEKFIVEFHSIEQEGHSRAYRTNRRLASNFY